MRTKLIILTSIAMALVVMAFPTNKFQPKTVWEHYCKYTLGIHPSQATEDQYDYFLDCWSGDDEYQYLYDYYENKYPEYNHQQTKIHILNSTKPTDNPINPIRDLNPKDTNPLTHQTNIKINKESPV